MKDVTWEKGPPPAVRDKNWWVCFESHPDVVILINVSPSVIHRNHPDPPLMGKFVGGLGFRWENRKDEIAFHAPCLAPDPPAIK